MTTDKARILIVDDDKNTRDGLERALGRAYDVSVVSNAKQALERLADA